MRVTLKSNAYFLALYLLFLFCGGVFLLLSGKTESHLFFNSFHSPFFDYLFTYITYLGDGLMAVLLTIILLAVKYRYAVIIGFSNLLASVFTQFLKHKVFVEELRPKKYFEGVQELYFVPGVENHLLHSFPSGHATSAFALYFSLALIVKGKMYNVLFFFIALLAAYSRVYLSQHFFEDIYIGSLIGVAFSLLVYWFMQKQDADWLEGSLIKAFEDQ